MAKSGIVNFGSSLSTIQMWMEWRMSPIIGKNRSVFNYWVYAKYIPELNSGSASMMRYQADFKFKVFNGTVPTLDDEKFFDTYNYITINANETKQLFVAGFEIIHNDWLTAPYATFEGSAWCSTSKPIGEFYINTTIHMHPLLTVPDITIAPNFNDEQHPTITFNNPSGDNFRRLEACISLTGENDDIPFQEVDVYSTSHTFYLSESDFQILRDAVPEGSNSRSVIFILRAWYGTEYWDDRETRTFSITNGAPAISATYYDIDAECVALTHNNGTFIKGFSDLEFQVDGIPKKGATIVSYKTTNGSNSSTLQRDVFTNVSSNIITFSATDNHKQTGVLELPFDMIEYFPVSCSFSAENIKLDEDGDGTTATAEIEISGRFFNDCFGSEGETNFLKLEILHDGLEDWFELPDILWGDNIEGNEYKASFSVHGLNYKDSITFQCRASDKLTTATTNEKTLRLLPVFDWGENDFNFNVPVSFQGESMADFIIETGTASMGSNGTWYWSKWKSGKAECYGIRNYGNMAVSTAWGSMYCSADFQQSLPFGLFATAPTTNITISGSESGAGWICTQGNSSASEYSTETFNVCRPTSYTMQQVYISFQCIGRWK